MSNILRNNKKIFTGNSSNSNYITICIGYLYPTNLADSTTYYFGCAKAITALTSDGIDGRSLTATVTGNIVQIDFVFGANVLSTENMTIQIHNKTQLTSVNATTTFSTSGQNSVLFDGFTLPINKGDIIGLRLITPIFANNPTNTTITGNILISY